MTQRGFKGFFVLMLLLAAVLMLHEWSSLSYEIEQANHRAELNNMRTDLIETWVHRQITHQSFSEDQLAQINPVRLLQSLPVHYLGELKQQPKTNEVWFYDVQHGCLVYRFKDGERVGYRLKRMLGKMGGLDLVREKKCEA